MVPASSQRVKLLVCFATVYLVWGSTYLVASIGLHTMPPFLFGGIRFVLAGVLLGTTALLLGQKFPLDATEWRHMFVVALGNVVIANGLTNIAMQHIASNQTAILNASAALWIALLATRGRRAHAIDRRTMTGLVIGFAGTALIIWPSGGTLRTNHIGMQLLVLVAVFSWSASTVYIRNVHSKLDVLPFTAVQMLLGGALMTAIGFAKGEAALWQWSKPGLVAKLHSRARGDVQLREPGDRRAARLVVPGREVRREPADGDGGDFPGRGAGELAEEGCEASRGRRAEGSVDRRMWLRGLVSGRTY
jgi:drug/metabolite transporter (DMT)-like permease